VRISPHPAKPLVPIHHVSMRSSAAYSDLRESE
jgi:hypothetical protein